MTFVLACEEKRRFQSRKKARDAVKQLHRIHARQPGAGGELLGLNVYRCADHECWHIGHKPGSSVRVARRRSR